MNIWMPPSADEEDELAPSRTSWLSCFGMNARRRAKVVPEAKTNTLKSNEKDARYNLLQTSRVIFLSFLDEQT